MAQLNGGKMRELLTTLTLAVAVFSPMGESAPVLTGTWAGEDAHGYRQTFIFMEDGAAKWVLEKEDFREVFEIRYDADFSAVPMRLDLSGFDRGPLEGRTLYGIVEFPDKLSFRFDCEPGPPDGGDEVRPDSFTEQTVHYRRDPADILAMLHWLEGDWAGTFAGHRFLARYTSPEGGMILSVSKQIDDGRVTLFELERFHVADGEVTLTPYPFGKAGGDTFKLTDYDPSVKRAMFSNPDHDYPTELTYEQAEPDRLTITLSGKARGSARVLVADLRRVP